MLELSQFAHFHFLRPWWFLALIPLIAVFTYLRNSKDPNKTWEGIISPKFLGAMLISHQKASWFNPVNAGALISLLFVIAAAGPTWKQQPSPFSEDISPLVVVLDASESMLQDDVQPNRLERAKQKIQDLLELRKGSRVSLVVYAGSAHTVIPLTNDADVVKNFLAAVKAGMMPVKGKFAEKALPIADEIMAESPVPGTILLITDGVGQLTEKAFADYFDQVNRQLIVYGIGKDAEAMEASGGYSEDAYLPLEVDSLNQLASVSGGYYQAMTLDKKDVRAINFRIDNHIVIVDDGTRPWVDSGYYLLFPIAAVFLLWFRRGWTLNWCIPLLAVLLSMPAPPVSAEEANTEPQSSGLFSGWYFADLWMTRDQQGQFYMQRGDYKTAAERYENIEWKAIAYYRNEEFRAAAEMFSRVDSIDGLFNMGNAYAHGREYLKARTAYNRVLKRQPDHPGALKNRALIQEIIDEINRYSASQQAEEGESSRDLGEEDAQTAEGADQKMFVEPKPVETLSADDVLYNEKMNETWMKQVQKDPSRFLSIKFQMQLRNQEQGNED